MLAPSPSLLFLFLALLLSYFSTQTRDKTEYKKTGLYIASFPVFSFSFPRLTSLLKHNKEEEEKHDTNHTNKHKETGREITES